MRGLTITQPWATLIAIGARRIETRSWRTAYIGELAIHAGKTCDADSRELFTRTSPDWPFCDALLKGGVPYRLEGGRYTFDLPMGAVVATSRMWGCPRMSDGVDGVGFAGPWAQHNHLITPDEIGFGYFHDGRYGWLLENVKPLRHPIPCRGAQGLWAVGEARLRHAADLGRQIREAA
jgi:activating signal cointegrator 1